MTVELDLNEQIPSKERALSPADYKDLDFETLKQITHYLTASSVPVNMTIREVQSVISAYNDLLNKSIHNLNVLRSLAGDSPFEIPVDGGAK